MNQVFQIQIQKTDKGMIVHGLNETEVCKTDAEVKAATDKFIKAILKAPPTASLQRAAQMIKGSRGTIVDARPEKTRANKGKPVVTRVGMDKIA